MFAYLHPHLAPYCNSSAVVRLQETSPNFYYSENADNHCEPIKRTGTLPPYWGWVQQATYAGKMMQKHVELDKWEYSVSRCALFRWWSKTYTVHVLPLYSQSLRQGNSPGGGCVRVWPKHSPLFRSAYAYRSDHVWNSGLQRHCPLSKCLQCAIRVFWMRSNDGLNKLSLELI